MIMHPVFGKVFRSPMQSVFPFSIERLFAGGEQGFWFDPADLSTLFQDTAGATPVTAAGQPVGLMLDKSRGLVLGPELVTNGGFDDASGWTNASTGTGTFTVASGVATLVGVDAINRGATRQAVTCVVGRFYEVTATATGAQINFALGSGTLLNGAGGAAITATGAMRLLVVATATTMYVKAWSIASGGTATIDNISVRELPGNHLTANADAARGTYNVDSSGRGFILFDGSDDGYVTPTITPGTDKVQVFAGVRKLTATTGIVVESGTSLGIDDGSMQLICIDTSASNQFRSRGTILSAAAVAAGSTPPVSVIMTGLGDISGDRATLRIDGTQVAQSTGDQGTGNYLVYPVYIGRRGGTSFPFNGRLYSLIVRFGPNLDAARIRQVERYVGEKTGVRL